MPLLCTFAAINNVASGDSGIKGEIVRKLRTLGQDQPDQRIDCPEVASGHNLEPIAERGRALDRFSSSFLMEEESRPRDAHGPRSSAELIDGYFFLPWSISAFLPTSDFAASQTITPFSSSVKIKISDHSRNAV